MPIPINTQHTSHSLESDPKSEKVVEWIDQNFEGSTESEKETEAKIHSGPYQL